MWIVHLPMLSSRSLLSIIGTHLLSPSGTFIIDYVVSELCAPNTFWHTLSGLLLVWHPRLQLCTSIVDACILTCSPPPAVGELPPVRWLFSGIGTRPVYRLLLYALLATGRCVCHQAWRYCNLPCLRPMGFGSLVYCYMGFHALWHHLCWRCR
jgi:hypothetical protein